MLFFILFFSSKAEEKGKKRKRKGQDAKRLKACTKQRKNISQNQNRRALLFCFCSTSAVFFRGTARVASHQLVLQNSASFDSPTYDSQLAVGVCVVWCV